MKNKGNIKILLPAVVLIWALLIYKFVAALNPEEQAETFIANTDYKVPEVKKRDTFSLQYLYHDPFLDKAYRKEKKAGVGSKSIATEPWPSIQFIGSVADNGGKDAVYILTVNGSQHLLKRGESAGDIKVISGENSQVKLRFNGQSKVFTIEWSY